jgi:hypothetical protein
MYEFLEREMPLLMIRWEAQRQVARKEVP